MPACRRASPIACAAAVELSNGAAPVPAAAIGSSPPARCVSTADALSDRTPTARTYPDAITTNCLRVNSSFRPPGRWRLEIFGMKPIQGADIAGPIPMLDQAGMLGHAA
jgi:hypothetical protein